MPASPQQVGKFSEINGTIGNKEELVPYLDALLTSKMPGPPPHVNVGVTCAIPLPPGVYTERLGVDMVALNKTYVDVGWTKVWSDMNNVAGIESIYFQYTPKDEE